jgi:beta-lactamase regulating signal transducer with metallopeptidase domain
MTSVPLAEATGLALLHLIWQGAIIAGLLAATLALMRRSSANSRYLVSCAALLMLLAAGVTTAVRSYTPAVQPAVKSSGAPPILAASWHSDEAATPISVTIPRLTPTSALIAIRPYTPYIVLFWLAGVVVFTLRLLVSWRRTTALLHPSSVPTARELQTAVNQLAERLGIARAVRLIQSSAVEVPSVVGWMRPVILVPISSVTGLTTEQLEMVLAHELAHIRRHDFLVNALQSAAETLLFYHPAAWWISQQIRIERENCCDDLAVATCGDPIRYARALAQLEHLRTVPLPAVAANGGSLFDRVRRLVAARTADGDALGWPAAAALVGFAVIGLAAVPLLAVAKPDALKPPRAATPVVAPTPPVPPSPSVAPTPRVATTPGPSPAPMPFSHEFDVPTPPSFAIAPLAPLAPMPAGWGVTPGAIADGVAGALADVDFEVDVDHDEDPDEPEIGASGKLTVDELISLRIHGVTAEYIETMRRVFGESLSLKEVVSLRIQGVSPQYVEDMRALFGKDLTSRETIGLKTMGVTAEWLRTIRGAGVDVKTARDASSLRAMGVTAEFVKSLAEAGYTNLTTRDLVRMASSGINAQFIREMSKYKTKK